MINYKLPAEQRWKILIPELLELSQKEKIKLVLKATEYQSGEGLLNTVYMGGLAHASLCGVLGIKYGDPNRVSYETRLNELTADTENNRLTINAAVRNCIHTIEYMLSNPVTYCSQCGQIIRA